jgi:hypothetical protein
MRRALSLGSSWLIAVIATLALVACDKADQAQRTAPPVSVSSASTPPPPQVARAGTNADETAKANADETAKASDEPMKSMTKDEEEKAMPQPGQANDHSTLAQDPKEPKTSQ